MNWQPLPFVRIFLPFALGILVGFYLPLSVIAVAAMTLMLCTAIVFVVMTRRKPLGIEWQRRFGIFSAVFWISFGYVWVYENDQRRSPSHFAQAPPALRYLASLEAPPQLYSNTFRAPLLVQALQDSAGNWQRCSGRLLASFECDSSTAVLRYGDQILIQSNISEITAPVNPHSFDAQWFYAMQNIHHSAYISGGYWQLTDSLQGSWIWSGIYAIRGQLLAILKEHLTTENEYAVGAALLFGVRDELSAELRNAYSDTGATHILAVSGMHVGILAYIWGWVLGWWKPRKKPALWGKSILLLGVIWLFVLLAGASPSVLRAGVMFSFICWAQTLKRQTHIFNTLASSAFALLLLNPYTLFDVGFQLSYLAVIGIVCLERPIYAGLYFPQRWLRWLWKMTAVSLAAQVATTPISLYYFHQFPASFWLSGLVAIPLSSAALPIGMFLLLMNWCTPLAQAAGWLLWACVYLMNAFIFLVQQIPGAVIEGIWLFGWEAMLWYLVIVLMVAGIRLAKLRAVFFAGWLVLVLGISQWYKTIKTSTQSLVWVYEVHKGTMVTAVSGNCAITLVDSAHWQQNFIDFTQQNHLWSLGVQERRVYPLQQQNLTEDFVAGSFPHFQFNHTRISIFDNTAAWEQPAPESDYKLLHRLNKLQALPSSGNYIFDASSSKYAIERWAAQCDSAGWAWKRGGRLQ